MAVFDSMGMAPSLGVFVGAADSKNRSGGTAMRRIFNKMSTLELLTDRTAKVLRIVLIVAGLAAIGYGGQITIFSDNFDGYLTGSNPGGPAVGMPWQISEAAPEGIAIDGDLSGTDNALWFNNYRNEAVAPFSVANQSLISQEKNFNVSFTYWGASTNGYSHYFDISALDPTSGAPAFFIRFSPQQNAGSAGLHDVQYLDPVGGLIDSGLDISTDIPQSVSITVDFISETYLLDISGSAVELPMFIGPSTVHGVSFANYGVALGSGSLDDLHVSVGTEDLAPANMTANPEPSSLILLAAGALFLLFARTIRRRVG